MTRYFSLISICILIFQSCNSASTHTNKSEGDPKQDSVFMASYDSNRQWPSFRGYYASGYLDNVHIPDTWDLASGKNILWKTSIPGLGLSSPAIWEDNIYITTAVSENDQDGIKTGIYGEGEPVADESSHEWKVLCINKFSGEIVWERVACTGVPEVKRHPKSSHANPSIAINGEYLVAFFGSEGLYCYDLDGNLIWEKDFGYLLSAPNDYLSAEWEFASSPIIHQESVIVQVDVSNMSFLSSIDIESGKTIWRTERNDVTGWCTPNIYYNEGKARVATNGYKQRGGYDFESGEEVWQMSGGGDVPVPAPINYKDLIFFNSAHGKHSPIIAMEKTATGTIKFPDEKQVEHVRWSINRGGAYMHTMLIYKDLLYNMKWNGSLSCYHPETGELYYKTTVSPGSFISSPVAADDRIYVISEEGIVYVIEAGTEYNLLNEFPLGEITLATPAITENIIVFRTVKHLIAVSGLSNTDP